MGCRRVARARDALVSGASKLRAGAAALDAFRSTRRRGDDSEDEDEDRDDAPLAVLGAQAPRGGHVVPSIDFSRLDPRGGERFSRDARDEAPAAELPANLRAARDVPECKREGHLTVRVRSSSAPAAEGEVPCPHAGRTPRMRRGAATRTADPDRRRWRWRQRPRRPSGRSRATP